MAARKRGKTERGAKTPRSATGRSRSQQASARPASEDSAVAGAVPGDEREASSADAAPRARVDAEQPAPAHRAPPEDAFLVAVVGSSAGGLEPLRDLLGAMPAEPGLAILVVQHMAPDRESLLPQILSNAGPVPVREAYGGQAVERDCVYVIPPGRRMDVCRDGRLRIRLEDRDAGTPAMPIDFMMRSLAHHVGDRAIGVVLSGTGSDGAQGMREIKAAGGITLVQEPTTARYDGMPRASLATDAVDMALPTVEIARELVRLAAAALAGAHPLLELPHHGEDFERLFALLRNETGVDFSHYKRPTIRRRLQRRMALGRVDRLADYLELLERQPEELRSLHRDLLIHVTRFFRDPGSFETLARQVAPALLEGRSPDFPLRVWIPGCATGEEAYSVAMVLLECLAERRSGVPLQIFATDVSEEAIERARTGLYPSNIEADVSEERLRRFFTHADGSYRIVQAVRDCCVFARQDVTRDPPFSKLDLVVCRNVMIYLAPILQQQLVQVFHYALKPRGYLMLGEVETVGGQSALFELVDKTHRLYAKRQAEEAPPLSLSFRTPQPRGEPATEAPRDAGQSSLQQRTNAVLLDRYAPPGVVVDGELQIVHTRGHTGPFLELSPGTASLSVLKMAREGIAHPLRLALQSARKRQGPVRREGLEVTSNGHPRVVNLEVSPITIEGKPFFLVLFETPARPEPPLKAPREPARRGRGRRRQGDAPEVVQLRQELEATREHLQSMIHDLEAANEELQSANEEILSSNEELQSTNEELDTAREELQSTNEEINTVNEELQGRNEELVRVNSDLVNLLGSVHIAIVIVDGELRIRRFTPVAGQMLNLIASDVGRPIGHIKPNVDCPELEALIADVVDRVTPVEREVQDSQGRWYSLRIRPYKNIENRIEGAVLALLDVNDPRSQAAALGRDGHAGALLDAVPLPLVALDATLAVRAVNRAFREAVGAGPDAPLRGQPFLALDGGRWDVPALRAQLEAPDRAPPAELSFVAADGAARRVRAQVRRVDGAPAGEASLLLCLEPLAY